jgi:5-methylcytosine-specific restriction endonuclease McrA
MGAKDRVKARASVRAWQLKYPEREREKVRAWKKANPDSVRMYVIARRAKLRNAPGDGVNATQWIQALSASCGLCAYCGEAKKLTMDHIDSIGAGGAHDISNIVPACRSCNGSKGDSVLIVWLAKRMKSRRSVRGN